MGTNIIFIKLGTHIIINLRRTSRNERFFRIRESKRIIQWVIIKINLNEYCSCDKPRTHDRMHYIYVYFRPAIKVDDIRIRAISAHENFPAQFFFCIYILLPMYVYSIHLYVPIYYFSLPTEIVECIWKNRFFFLWKI